MNVKTMEFVTLILRRMVPIQEVLEVLVPQKNLAGLEIALVPQDFVKIASFHALADGVPTSEKSVRAFKILIKSRTYLNNLILVLMILVKLTHSVIVLYFKVNVVLFVKNKKELLNLGFTSQP